MDSVESTLKRKRKKKKKKKKKQKQKKKKRWWACGMGEIVSGVGSGIVSGEQLT